jgi:hydroxyethylthiazole kinase-like uncharacterized protein yjeF
MRAVPEIAAHVTSIMVHPLDGPSGLSEMLEDTRFNAICLGPALGLTQATADLVRAATGAGRFTLLDADALSRFERAPEALFSMLHPNCVITPHAGEFRRLFPDLADGADRCEAVLAAAKRAGCVVLLKGAETLVADPEGRIIRHQATGARATPWLATAGAGDVLAGLIVGLGARGFAPSDAASVAAFLHVEAALTFGPGLIAEDLPDVLPQVLSSLQEA